MTLPNEIPVMLLPGCNLFPHALLPLFIFEDRYRAMLRRALDRDRLFCVGTLLGDPGCESDDGIDRHSTAGFVRACVGNPDGTSHLVLQGIRRIRLTGWIQREPFRIASIEPVPTYDSAPADTRLVASCLLKLVLSLLHRRSGNAEQLASHVRALTDPSLFGDFVASHFVNDARRRHPLLRMTDVNKRLHYLHTLLVPDDPSAQA